MHNKKGGCVMQKTLNILTLLFICGIFISCSKNPVSPSGAPRELTSLERTVANSGGNFGFKIFKEINKTENGNIFISPLSISMALGMTNNGAAGTTAEAMQNTLGLTGLSNQEINESYQSLIDLLINIDPKVIFQLANSIWYRNTITFEETFLNLCKTFFNAQVTGLDFNDPGAPAIINAWVDNNTNGKIKEIIKSINPLTVMYLINAIYFKGTWTYEFKEENTKDDEFTLSDGSKLPCKMMTQSNDFQYYENPDFQAIELPYGDEHISMVVFLPKPGKKIDDLIEDFSSENITVWINNLSKKGGIIELPKFKFDYKITLNDVLSLLGMEIAFDQYNADFTNMYKEGGLYISKVGHKTFVEVNEEGTEAAAVTYVVMSAISVGGPPPPDFTMRVNRPFIFIIRETGSNTILFIGKITEPVLE